MSLKKAIRKYLFYLASSILKSMSKTFQSFRQVPGVVGSCKLSRQLTLHFCNTNSPEREDAKQSRYY